MTQREAVPPTIPQPQKIQKDHSHKFLVGFGVFFGLLVGTLLLLQLLTLLQFFTIPTGSMTPAISPGDHVVMEGLAYLVREPRRGDVVIFKADGIPMLPAKSLYHKRIVGEPGERLRIADGQLYINDAKVTLSNAYGEISFALPPQLPQQPTMTNVTIPAGNYFVVGDNSTNSLDSRYWGFLPKKNIKGRISICYWPPARMGAIK